MLSVRARVHHEPGYETLSMEDVPALDDHDGASQSRRSSLDALVTDGAHVSGASVGTVV